jgi:hypothetical protein
MLTHPTEQRLIELGLAGMAKALEEQRRLPDVAALTFEERLGLLVDCEALSRNNKRLGNRLKFAGLTQATVVEDVDLKAARQLDKPLFAKLAAGDWIDRRQNLIIIGETGLGKSWLACALGHKACRDDRAVLYQRVPRMFDALALGRGDGRHALGLRQDPRLTRQRGSGAALTIVASLVETCRLNAVNPHAWLPDTLTKLVNRCLSRKSMTSCPEPRPRSRLIRQCRCGAVSTLIQMAAAQ